MKPRPQVLAWIGFALAAVIAAGGVIFVSNMTTRNDLIASDVSDIVNFMTGLTAAAVGALVADRRSRNPLGWIMLTLGLALTLSQFLQDYTTLAFISASTALPARVPALWTDQWLWLGSYIGLDLILLLFPTGQFLSPRWRWVARFSVIAYAALVLVLAANRQMSVMTVQNQMVEVTNPFGLIAFDQYGPLAFLFFGVLVLPLVLALFALLLRFRRVTPVERQQLKWFLYAATLFTGILLPASVFNNPFVGVLVNLAGLAMPIAIGIAVLRYRLWDIDILIRRTLIYGVLTALLLLLYLISVTLIQALLSGATGQRSEIAVIVSTLGIAALFIPLRQRIQSTIDRRFYRRRYDAAQVLAIFGKTVRDEVDLQKLTEELVTVVQETMEPAQVSLWLRSGLGRELKR